MSPTRTSRRLADRAAKKLCFNNPLTQTITTKRYVKSHIDLLAEDASPYSATDSKAGTLENLDLTMAYNGDETRDGGQTPGPFEEMRRRMAGLDAESDSEAFGSKKRKRKVKNRQWVWTIGTNEDDPDIAEPMPTTALKTEAIHALAKSRVDAMQIRDENDENAPATAILLQPVSFDPFSTAAIREDPPQAESNPEIRIIPWEDTEMTEMPGTPHSV